MHRKKVILLFPFVLALVLLTGWLQLARLDAAASPNTTPPSSNINLTFLNQMGGATYSVKVAGNYAYVGTGPRLQIFDIQNPSNPVLLGQSVVMRGTAVSLYIAGNYAFVLSNGNLDPINQLPNELYVFDITDPTHPVWWGTAPLAGHPTDITLAGNYAYITMQPVWNGTTYEAGGLYIFDITNPGIPLSVGYYDTDGPAYDVVVQGNRAYVGAVVSSLMDLLILNISNPVSPTLVNNINMLNSVEGLHINGNILYLTSGVYLEAYSLSDPDNPALLGGVGTPTAAYDVVVAGNYAYVANNINGLQIVDVTNPANMFLAGNYDAPHYGFTWNLDVSGGYAYLAYMVGGFKVVDVSTPSNPQGVSSHNQMGNVSEVAAAGNLLYTIEVNDTNDMRIYDASDPFNLTQLGAYTQGAALTDIVVSGTHAYLGGLGLRVMDISDPTHPYVAGYLSVGSAHDVELVGSYAYLTRNSNILIVDVSNPTTPTALGSVNTTGFPREMDISGTHAFVANSSGMAVVNISNPMAPTLVTTYNPYQGEVSAIAVKGDYAYLAVETEGIYVLDISNPASPQPVAFTALAAGTYTQATIQESSLSVSAATYGFYVLDISNPVSPTLSASYDTANYTWGTFDTGNRLYAGDSSGGLYIFSTSTLPGLSVSNEAAMEGNGGFPNLLFEIHLSAASTRTITVSYTTVDGTAQAGSDYITTSGTLTFQPGSTLEHVPVSLIPDTVLEPDETFSLVISDPVNAVITDNSGAGTIINDDLPEMFISDSTVVEGDSGTQTATFTVTLSAPGTLHVAASYQTFDGTAQAGSDYAAANGAIFIPAGQTTQVISMTIYGDSDIEPDETFTVEIAKENNVILADYIGMGTILNDDVAETNATVYLPLMLKP